jgi:hypothetical protein
MVRLLGIKHQARVSHPSQPSNLNFKTKQNADIAKRLIGTFGRRSQEMPERHIDAKALRPHF